MTYLKTLACAYQTITVGLPSHSSDLITASTYCSPPETPSHLRGLGALSPDFPLSVCVCACVCVCVCVRERERERDGVGSDFVCREFGLQYNTVQ